MALIDQFAPRKEIPVPIAEWAPGSVWKISPAPGFDPSTLESVASRYTDYALPAHKSDASWEHESGGAIFHGRLGVNWSPQGCELCEVSGDECVSVQ
jgi:hypothetical protein